MIGVGAPFESFVGQGSLRSSCDDGVATVLVVRLLDLVRSLVALVDSIRGSPTETDAHDSTPSGLGTGVYAIRCIFRTPSSDVEPCTMTAPMLSP